MATLLVLVVSAGLLAFVAIGTGRALAAALAVVAIAFGFVLALRAHLYESVIDAAADAGEWALALGPGVLIAFFGFNGGGYFAGAQAFVALVLAIVLALRMWFASEPFAGFGPLGLVAAGCLAIFGVWTALSASWSDAPGRALLESDRVLLYLLALLVFASFARSTVRLRLMVRGAAAGALLVCTIGLVTRVLPDVWPIAPDIQRGRLSYPLTYWNALGLLGALGLVFATHLASSEREPRLVRVLGAAAMPVLGTAIFFTFSRGAIAVAIVGLVAYALLSRPRGLIGGLVAGGPATALAIVTAYHADLLSSDNPTSSAAASQGHHVALIVALCAIGAALVRVVLLPLDGALERVHLPRRARRWVPATAWALAAVLALAVFLAAHGPHSVSSNYKRFVRGNAVVQSGDLRSRLGDPGNNRRIDQWDVALDAYRTDSFQGTGAGTYENFWNEHRKTRFAIRDAHSLYVEVLGELGLTGLVLLAVSLALIAFAFARGVWRARDRYVYAALLAAALAWLLRAGLDWDWEMPAVTIWLFCAGGAALAVSSRNRARKLRLATGVRLALALVCLAVGMVPAAIAVSQHRLDDARRAFAKGDCTTAEREAHRSLDVIAFRAEPQDIIAVCAARRGAPAEAAAAGREAVRRDPGHWRYRYDLAIALALDPRRSAEAVVQARAAARLNPLEPIARGEERLLAGPTGEEWAGRLARAAGP
jgi:O-Antigen ligase